MALWKMGARELAAAIRRREASSREVLDSLRARRDHVNGAVNAIVDDVTGAEEAAAAADRAVVSDGPTGPFHGVPISIKTNIDVAGSPTTHGSSALAGAIAATDAPLVERMRSSGAIPFARTNMPDFGLRNHTSSSLYGRTTNPWDPTRTAGGSSGGEAVAIATGMSPLGFGNDVAGSLRNPAHCCGVVSIKPSTGVVPHATSLPPNTAPISYQLMLAQGILGRTVGDVSAALAAIAGPHDRDPLALPLRPPRREPASTRLRIAVALDPPDGRSDPAVRSAIGAVADLLSDDGHEVLTCVPDSYGSTAALTWDLLMADFRVLRSQLGDALGDEATMIADNMGALIDVRTADQLAVLHLERSARDLDWHQFLTTWDVLLTPVSPTLARAHGSDIASVEGTAQSMAGLAPLLPANLLGLPATAVPCGTREGLPVAAQFIGRRFHDHVTLAAAQIVENHVGPLTPVEPAAHAGH